MTRQTMQPLSLIASLIACAGCEPAAEAPRRPTDDLCRVEAAAMALPLAVRETSGLVVGADALWTHNDRGNAPVLYSLSDRGALLGATTVTSAELFDWEDMEAAPCDTGRCFYIADIGDNSVKRAGVTIYEVPEPSPAAERTAPARALRARYPDGAHNAEALFALEPDQGRDGRQRGLSAPGG